MRLKARASRPNSFFEFFARTGTRVSRSPWAMRSAPSVTTRRLRVMRVERGRMPKSARAVSPRP